MRSILVVINSLGQGGAERLVIDQINGLIERGVKTKLVTLRREKTNTQSLDCHISKSDWECIHFRSFYDLLAWHKLIVQLKNEKPEAIVTHLWFSNTIGRIAAVFAGIPKVFSYEHNVYDRVKSHKQFLIDKFLSRFTNKIIAVSKAVRDSLVGHGIPEGKIVVVYNGIPLDKNIRSVNPKTEDPDKFTFLYVGRLNFQKGVDILLRSFAKIKAKGYLMIVGEGEERPELIRIVEDERISSRVRFLGFKSNVRDIMGTADCLVLPSRWEGLGIVLLEALSVGLPIIASRLDAVCEVLDNDSALLFTVGDENELSQKMNLMLENSELREQLRVNARRRLELFSIEKNIDCLLKVINEK